MTWTSDNPMLSGNFAPVLEELTLEELPVSAGAIPTALDGAYFRNGPNPAFEPLSYTYPYDGDGMVHGVYLQGGKAGYRNRFVETRGLLAERRAGRALYGGVTTPWLTRADLLGPEDDPPPFKNGAFIHVFEQGGKLIAPYEAAPAYALTWDLETLGIWCAGGERPLAMSPHSRRSPITGDRFALAYSADSPEIALHRIDREGLLVETLRTALEHPTMLHDFVLTERFAVVLAGPVIFDLKAAERGGGLIQWRPEIGTKILIWPLDGSPLRRLEAEPFFVFHLANGFEDRGRILLDYVRHPSLRFGVEDAEPSEGPRLHRMEIDLSSGVLKDRRLSERPTEFPRANETFESQATRYTYSAALTGDEQGPAGTFHAVMRVDGESGEECCRDVGSPIGEPVFVPNPTKSGEDQGYLALFRYDPDRHASDFLLLDARDIEADPVAVIELPCRVPQGLHGSWVPRAACQA